MTGSIEYTAVRVPAQPWPVAGDQAYRMLFVSDDAGERASIAAHLATRMGGDWMNAECVGFSRESRNPWNDRELADLIVDQGVFLSAAYPQLLGVLLNQQQQCRERFDCIVLIAGERGPGFVPLFRRLAQMLVHDADLVQYWQVPAIGFDAPLCRPCRQQVTDVIDELRDHTAWLLANLSEHLRVA